LGLGLGLLPGNTPPVGEVLVIGGALAWIAGAMVQPLGRFAPKD
jgi:hypothetical protein